MSGGVERRWRPRHPGWPAPLWHGPSSLRHPPSVVERTAQQHLDLGIETAELICRPAGQGIMDSGIDPKEYLLAITHGSRVERASVDDWRSRLVTAEYDHKVAHHRCFAFLVEVDDAALIKPFERQFNHSDSALDDA